MKRFFLFTAILFSNIFLFVQVNKPPDNTAHYQVEYKPSTKLNVTKVNNSLFLEIVGQGKTELIPLGGNSFKAKYLPGARIDFIRDSVGNTIKFKWSRAPGKAMWNRVSESDLNISNGTPENLAVYAGKYSVIGNGYPVILIKADSD